MLCFALPLYEVILNERPLARRPFCFHIMNRVPERYIDLASGTCNKILSAPSFKIMKGNTQSYVEYFTN